MSSEERVVSDVVWTPERGLSAPEVRGIAWDNFLLSDDKYLGKWKTDSGVRVTPETALQSTVVLACCRILAETISGLPIHVYRRNEDGSEEIAREVPLYKVLSFSPNEWQTKPEFFEQIVMNLTLWGNSYSRIRSGKYGSVSALDNFHPSRMEVERLENGRLRYSYTDPETGRLERYTQDQIMHIRWTPEQDGIKGMVPVEVAREAIGLARACEQHAARFWANSARPGVVLTTEGTLTAEAAERLRDNWERLHRGSERAYRTAVLTGGMKATELGFTNEASQFNATRAAQTEEIARVYRLPLHLIQGTSGGDLEVQGQEFVTYTLMPWLTRIESAISRSLIVNDDAFYAKFDVRGLLRANSQQRASYYSTMMNLGVLTINDVRRQEGLKTLGEIGDHHFVPMNTQTLEDATKPKPEAPPGGMPPMGGGGGDDGDGPPPPAPGGPPSMSEVKTGKAPIASPKGEASKPKMEDAVEESSADWEDAIEARAFCATGVGNGVDNSCGSSGETGASQVDNSWKKSFREYTYTPGGGDSPISGGDDINSLRIEGGVRVAEVMSDMKLRSLTDVIAIGGGLTRGSFTSVHAHDGKIVVSSEVPAKPDDEESAGMSSTVMLGVDNEGMKFVDYGSMVAASHAGTANLTGEDAARMSSILLEKFPESLAAAERSGFSYAKTHAAGSAENEFKGYRIWPHFGFDAELDKDIREKIPKDIIAQDGPATVQQLISTPAGKRWWNENGESISLTLNLKDKNSDGYKQYKKMAALSARMKKRNEGRSLFDVLFLESRAFCATGAGGGIDNSCGLNRTAVADNDSASSAIPAGDASLVNYKPFASIGDTKNSAFATPPSEENIKSALNVKQREKFGSHRDLPAGTPIDLRIDINAFKNHKVYAVTAHEHEGGTGVGKAIGYDTHIRLSGPVEFKSNENSAEAIGKGRAKGTHSTVKGAFDPSREIPADIDTWTPVGYDPYKATYYYDKRTGDEVIAGTDALSLGNTVFTRNPRYGNAKDPSKPPRNAKTDYRSLSAANLELYEAQEEIAEENGKWPQAEAHYMDKNPFASRGIKCSNCVYFENGLCEIVSGSVSPEGICKLWIIPDEKLSHPEQRAFCATGEGGGIDNSCGGAGGSNSVTITKLLEKIASNPDGFTLDPLSAEQPSDGIMVSEFANDSKRSVQIKSADIDTKEGADKLAEWYSENADVLVGQGNRFVGGWRAGDDYYIDIATRFPPEKAAEALEAGRNSGQLAVFNLGTFKETWVQYESDDKRKPAGFDKAFAKARKDSQEKQVYDSETPAIQEEDWAKELSRHGKTTVRSYNGKSEEDANDEQSSAAIRHPEQAHDHRGFSCDEVLLREGRGVEGQEARSGVVRRRAGEPAESVQGSAASPEARDSGIDCGRGPGGTFGPGNKCQAEGDGPTDAFGEPISAKMRGGGASSPSRADQSWKKSESPVVYDSKALASSPPARSLAGVETVTILNGKTLAASLKETGVTLDQAAKVCASLSADSNVTIAHGTMKDIIRYMDDPSLASQPESSITVVSNRPVAGIEEAVSASATLTRTDEDELLLTYSMLAVSPEAQQSASVTVGREMYKSVVKSITEGEKIGVSEVLMLAAGDKNDDMLKGYRIWPRLGFDGTIPREMVTPRYSAKKGFFESYGSKIPNDILSSKAKAEKKAGKLTIQSLYETSEGQKWWEENGSSLPMSLRVGDESDPGWQRFSRIRDRVSGRSMDEILDCIEVEWRSIRGEAEERAFCPTGAGGGIDNSCGAGSSSAAADDTREVRIGDSRDEINKRLDGMSVSMDQVVGMAGGDRGDAGVYIRRDHETDGGGGIHVECEMEVAGVPRGVNSVSVIRNAGTEESPEIIVDHKLIDVSPEVKADPEKRHAAAREFFRVMVDSASASQAAGASKIVLNAAGSPKAASDGFFKGYSIWPRMGFDAPIPRRQAVSLPPTLAHCRTLLDLHATPEGTRWWRDNGEDVDVQLDLKKPNSPQMQVFNRFRSRFGKDARSMTTDAAGGWLSPQDEEKLEELWSEIWTSGLLDSLDHADDDFSHVEKRAFCATGVGGGVDNSCGSSVSSGKPASVVVESDEKLQSSVSAIGASGVDDVLALGGGNLRGSHVAIAADPEPDGSAYISVTTTAPVERDNSTAEQFNTQVAISVGPNGREIGFESLGLSGHGQMTKASEQKVMSLVSEKVIESISTAERLNFDRVTTFAIGDSSNGYKGYRLWPQFGFDGDVPRDIAKRVPSEIILRAKGVDIPPPGSTSIPHDLVVKSLASRHRSGLTIQELISTREGDLWWDKNGDDIVLKLDLKDKASLGYQRWEKMKSRLSKLKERNQTREFLDGLVEGRAFCATGEGGGIDNSCSAHDGEPSDAFGQSVGGFARTGDPRGGRAPEVDRPPADARVDALTTQSLFSGTERMDLPKSRGAVSEEAISRAMTQRAIEAHGGAPIDVNKAMSQQDIEVTSDALARDTEGAYQRTGKHAGWYSQDVGDSIEIASKLPGNERIASDPIDRFVFGFGMGILSAQNTVKDNFRFADGFYRNWKETGSLVVPEEYAHVLGRGIDASHFKTMQDIVDQNGWKDTMAFFSGEDTVRQIKQDGSVILAGSDMTVGKEHMGTVVPRLAVFGPKIGPFTHAIVNGNFHHLVMDRWTMRQAGALTGTLLEETSPDVVRSNVQRVLEATSGIRGGHDLWQGMSKSDVVSSLKKAAKSGYLDRESDAWEFIRRTQSAYARSPSATGGGFGDKTELNKAANAAFKNKVVMNLAPGNGTVANNVRAIFNRAAEKVGASDVLEVQALGWGDTQKLWQHLGYRLRVSPDNNTFSHAASLLRDGAMERITSLRAEAERVAAEKAKKDAENAAKKSKRSLGVFPDSYQESSEWPYLDGVGAEPQLVFDESMSDESARRKVVDHVTSLIKKSKKDSRSQAAATVIELRSAGTTSIVMPSSGRDGLHVMGFDAEIPSDLTKKLPESLSHCKTLLDLHVSEEGSSWWEQNGREIDVSIDLEGVQGRIFDGFAAGKPFSDIIEEGILDDYGNS